MTRITRLTVTSISLLCALLLSATTFAFNLQFLNNSPIAKFDEADIDLIVDAFDDALDNNADGIARNWKNEKTANFGKITPLDTTREGDLTCRNVEIENNAKSRTGVSRFKYCKKPDGPWQLAQ